MSKSSEYSSPRADYNSEYYARPEVKQLRASPEYKKKATARQRKRNAVPEVKLKTRERRLKTKYGLTRYQWELMFEAQGRCCAICKRSDPGSPKGWSTDHCHITEIVRGILCPRCNKALGLFADSIDSLKSAISYLIRR